MENQGLEFSLLVVREILSWLFFGGCQNLFQKSSFSIWISNKILHSVLDDFWKKYISLIIDFNAKDNDGLTVFMMACYNGHKNVVKLLLEVNV